MEEAVTKAVEINRFNRVTKCDGKILRFMLDGAVITLDVDNAAELAYQLDKNLMVENHALDSNS